MSQTELKGKPGWQVTVYENSPPIVTSKIKGAPVTFRTVTFLENELVPTA
jgi:hypothetical protein